MNIRYMHEPTGILSAVIGSQVLRTHRDLFRWLRGEVQEVLPHDILVAAWGDFEAEQVFLDVVSALPDMRTTLATQQQLLPLVRDLFATWRAGGYSPFATPIKAGAVGGSPGEGDGATAPLVAQMRSAVVHGIKDERGWHDCLYVALSGDPAADPAATGSLALLLPYLDAALRQVRHLPMQRQSFATAGTDAEAAGEGLVESPPRDLEGLGLSAREMEIMRWVSVGKTNIEIGRILDISASTVRNHLLNVFRKLEVTNRAQAVFRIEQLASAREVR